MADAEEKTLSASQSQETVEVEKRETVEEEMNVDIEQLPEESSGSNPEGEEETSDFEQNLEHLVKILQLPINTLQSVAESEQGKFMIEKIVEHLNEKYSEIEDYESALNEVTVSMSQLSSEFAFIYSSYTYCCCSLWAHVSLVSLARNTFCKGGKQKMRLHACEMSASWSGF